MFLRTCFLSFSIRFIGIIMSNYNLTYRYASLLGTFRHISPSFCWRVTAQCACRHTATHAPVHDKGVCDVTQHLPRLMCQSLAACVPSRASLNVGPRAAVRWSGTTGNLEPHRRFPWIWTDITDYATWDCLSQTRLKNAQQFIFRVCIFEASQCAFFG